MTHPFAVGDRIHEVRSLCYLAEGVTDALATPEWELDPCRPDATVTALTARGFTYRYDYPISIGRAAWGTTTEGGECFEGGFHMWRKVS